MNRPNILILYTDQQRWDALGANGNSDIRTPNLDRLARRSVNFDHCFVQNPVCMPSRISFLSGRYPSSLGITHMGVPVPEQIMTLPKLLSQYGYYCANLGKLHFLPHANRDHRRPHPDYGFDQLEIADEPGVYEDAYRAWVRRMAPDQLVHLSVGLPPATAVWNQTMGVQDDVRHPSQGGRADFNGPIPFPGDENLTHSAFVADRTIRFLRDRPTGRPFLCIAGFYSPHAPWVVPQRYLDQYDPRSLTLPSFPPEVDAKRQPAFSDEQLRGARQGYYAMVSEVDHHVGRILEEIDAQGLERETIVIFTSDHGEWLGEYLRYGKGYPGQDAVSRVPLLVRIPAMADGLTVHDLVEAVDVLPTLLEATGIQIPPDLQGRSLWPYLNQGCLRPRFSVLMEATDWRTIRTSAYRYIMHADGRDHLYDLRRQWGEYRDVVAEQSYAADLSALRREMLRRLIELERPLPRVWPY